jgi:hypothetical protein
MMLEGLISRAREAMHVGCLEEGGPRRGGEEEGADEASCKSVVALASVQDNIEAA